jgi:ribosomal RNA-processing protein 36
MIRYQHYLETSTRWLPNPVAIMFFACSLCHVDLSSLPLGTLRKAQQALAQAKSYEMDEKSDDDNDDGDESSAPEQESSGLNSEDIHKKREIAKRANKHAYVRTKYLWHNLIGSFSLSPMEMSSKRQVPRKKANIEDSRPVSVIYVAHVPAFHANL